MARKLHIRVDHLLCVGNAMCETFAPKVFKLNETASRKLSILKATPRRKSSRPRRIAPSVQSLSRTPKPGSSYFHSHRGVDLWLRSHG